MRSMVSACWSGFKTDFPGPGNRSNRPSAALDLSMDYLLEFVSISLAIALVAFGLMLIQRSHGIAVLETVPLATGLSLFSLGSIRPDSTSTLHTPALILPIVACGLLIRLLQPCYARWRLRVAGESTTLLLSFALMNCCLLGTSIATSARSVPLGLADSSFIRTKFRLELIVVALSSLALAVTILYLRQRRLIAALQLSKDDHRLLATFGRDSNQVRRHVLVVATGLCTLGMFLFVSLQETFAVLNSYAVLVPSFAIAISQSRIRVGRLVTAAFLLTAVAQLATQYTSELLRDFHPAVLFSLFVLRRVSIALRHSHGEFTDFCLVAAC
jgi:hypothetical protein